MKVAVAAPTGKASARLNDVFKTFNIDGISENIIGKINNLEAKTIHRLLGGYRQFRHNAENLLDLDLLIVDECSMIDAALMAKMMAAVPEGARLILLGDRNQLSSVEAGSVFADLCVAGLQNGNVFSDDFISFNNELIFPQSFQLNIGSGKTALSDAITELSISHRFKEGEGISRFSRLTISGKVEDFNYNDYIEDARTDQFVQIRDTKGLNIEENPEFKKLIKEIEAYLKEDDIAASFAKLNHFKILCATREGKFGMHSINRLIEKSLGIKTDKKDFYHKQPVLITFTSSCKSN
jgi:exodeoxyribonuclease V alpha subunit